jgi:hypothetical protein
MTCPPFCAKCGGNLGHPANGNELCKKCNPSSTPPPDKVIPREIAEQVLSMGRVEWGETDEFTASGHLAHLEETLRITREHFNFEDVPVPMHGLYLEGTETVLCHTGTSPNSGPNAQALAGAWNWLHDQCLAMNAARSNQEATPDEGHDLAEPPPTLEAYLAELAPLDGDLADELRLWAKHLRTWTCDVEQFGTVRPLNVTLKDAADALDTDRAKEFATMALASTGRGPLSDEEVEAAKQQVVAKPVQEVTRTVGDAEERLRDLLDTERYKVAIGVQAIRKALDGRRWLSEAGRGSYTYDDERYQQEFGAAIDEIDAALEPLRQIAGDWSDCPTDPLRVAANRTAALSHTSSCGENS